MKKERIKYWPYIVPEDRKLVKRGRISKRKAMRRAVVRRNRAKNVIRDEFEQSLRKKMEAAHNANKKGKGVPEVDIDPDKLLASICRASFYDFVQEFWHEVVAEAPVWNWHIRFLCEELQVMAERVFDNKPKAYDLVVNIAPGSTKSLIMSVMFPMWCWTRLRSFRFIGASYSYPLAMDLSMKSRDVVRSDKFKRLFPEVEVRDDQNTKGYFKTKEGGYRYAVGVNGSITGMHAHVIVIDDPLNPQEALSSTDIATANHWIKNTLSNRKVDKSVVPMILVMQRLHQDDPTTHFLQNKKVRHICLPAEIEEGMESTVKPKELEKFYVDGLMDPVRLSREVLDEERDKGEFYYSSQFRQDPVPAGGGMFRTKKLKHGPVPDKFVNLVRFWDKAGTQGGGAYTVGTKMGLDFEGRYWILDIVRVQLDAFERERLIETTAEMDGYDCIVGVEQEPGSGGKESAESTVKNLAGFRVRVLKADGTTGGKERRADPFAVQVNGGNCYLPQEFAETLPDGRVIWSDWCKDWVEEFKYFPHSKFKDQVDSASGAFTLCQKRKVRIGGMDPSGSHVVDPTQRRMENLRKGRYKDTLKRKTALGVK